MLCAAEGQVFCSLALSRGVMQVSAFLWVMSKAPLMTEISSDERLPPSPSVSAWMSIKAFS